MKKLAVLLLAGAFAVPTLVQAQETKEPPKQEKKKKSAKKKQSKKKAEQPKAQ